MGNHCTIERLAGLAAVMFCAALNAHTLAGTFKQGEFITYSQDSWGAAPVPGNAAYLLWENFDSVYPAGCEVGVPGLNGFSMLFTWAPAVHDYLPASGANGPLNNDLIDPTSTAAGELGGHILALKFDVDLNDSGDLSGNSTALFGDLVIVDTVYATFNGLTVREYLIEANEILGAVQGVPSYDNIAFLTNDITRAFEGGVPSQFAQDHLRLPCSTDINGDQLVNVDDLLAVINAWGACSAGSCTADLDFNGVVNVDDLLAVINAWGACR